MGLPLALMAIGTGVSIYGTMKAAKDEKRYRKLQAQLANQEADEILLRNEINNRLLYRESKQLLGKQQVAIAGSGRSVGGMTSLELADQVMQNTALSVALQTREAQFNAAFKRAGGESQLEAGEAAMKAAKYKAFGTLVTAGVSSYTQGLLPNMNTKD